MKKKSVVLIILTCFWFAYTSFTIGFYFFQASRHFESNVERRKEQIDFHLDNASHYLLSKKTQSLVPRLKAARELGQFDFFLLRQGDQVLGFANKDDHLDGINHDYQTIDQFQEGDNFSLKTIAVFDYKLTVGINKSKNRFVWSQFLKTSDLIGQDLLAVTLIVLAIAYLVLKDIVKISHALQTQNRSSIKKITTRSAEAETLWQAAIGFEELNHDLRSDNLLLASSLGPAIKEEINSGKEAPYLIPCTLVRVDINGYTQMFLQKDPTKLFSILSEYFRKSREIIERYDGLIYQYVGDEIIFFFKSARAEESCRKGLSAVRSLFEMSQNIATAEVPDGIKLKASIVPGHLHFVKLDQGHSFSGMPLIESVRMLGQVTEKAESRLIVPAETLEMISDLCHANQSKTTIFKGFEEESHLLEISEFIKIQHSLKTRPPEIIGDIYRGDEDIIAILMRLSQLISSQDTSAFIDLAKSFFRYRISEVSEGVLATYTHLFNTCFRQNLLHQNESRVLATTVTLSRYIIPMHQMTDEISTSLDRCEQAKDPRVIANTMEAKSHFNLPLKRTPKTEGALSHRLSATVVLAEGKSGLTANVTQKIHWFLNSPDPMHIASGLFLVAYLYEYHHKKDAIYVRTNPRFLELIKQIPTFVNHENPIVRKRAQITEIKTQNKSQEGTSSEDRKHSA